MSCPHWYAYYDWLERQRYYAELVTPAEIAADLAPTSRPLRSDPADLDAYVRGLGEAGK